MILRTKSYEIKIYYFYISTILLILNNVFLFNSLSTYVNNIIQLILLIPS